MPEAVIVNPFMHPDVIVHLRDDQEIVENRVTVGENHDMRLGAGAYTASALKRQAWGVNIVDAIGDDIFGEYTFRESLAAGFGMDHVVRYQGSHMFLLSVADQKSRGGTMVSSCPPEWQRSAAEIESSISAAPAADAFYIWSWFWSYANKNLCDLSTTHVLAEMRSKARLVVLDPNWKPPGRPPTKEVHELVQSLSSVDILKLNRRDAAVLIGEKDAEESVKELHGLGASIVVLTLGEQGCALGGEGISGVEFVPSATNSPKHTTGAGDVFGGSFIARYEKHGDPLRAAEEATHLVGEFLTNETGQRPDDDPVLLRERSTAL